MKADIQIIEAASNSDYATFGHIAQEYVDWCRERYKAHQWFVEEVFGHQSIDAELKDMRSHYGPPKARTLLALRDGKIVAGGAYRHFDDGVTEMKRFYVRDGNQGLGIGRKLCAAIIEGARAEGYGTLLLDTGIDHHEALKMYESFGFTYRPPYKTYPDNLMPFLTFMELNLR